MPPSVSPLTPSATATARTTSEDPLGGTGGAKWDTTADGGGAGPQHRSYEPIQANADAAGAANNVFPNVNSSMMMASPYPAGGGFGSGVYGNYGGYNSMYGGGMYGDGMYGGGMMSPYSMMSPGPLSGLNQFLFSVQSVIFSLGQAVQIIGMNTQGLKQLLESATAMFDHAVQTWQEMQSLEQKARHHETEEDRKRRSRLRAMRMALVAGISYLGYRLVRRIIYPQRRHRPVIADGRYYGQKTYASPNQSVRPHGSATSGYYP